MTSTTTVIDAVNTLLGRTLTSYGSPLPPDARRGVKQCRQHRRDLDPAILRLQRTYTMSYDATDGTQRSLHSIVVMSTVLDLRWWHCKLDSDNVVCTSRVVGQIGWRFKYYHTVQLWQISVPYPGPRYHVWSEPGDVKRSLIKQKRNAGLFPHIEEDDLRAEVDALAEAHHTLELYDLPLCMRADLGDHLVWRCEIAPIRAFLRNIIGPVRGQTFPLMRLPAELRLQIFEHALRYPSSGLSFQSAGSRFHIRESQRSFYERSTRPSKSRQSLYTDRPADLLALLLVSKDISKEATPIFYRDNSFHAASPIQLIDLLRGCGARRRKYFTDISVNCSLRCDAAPAESAFRLLAGVPGLRRLTLKIWDLQWLLKDRPQITRRGVRINTASMWDVDNVLALVELGKCKVHRINFQDSCTRFIAYVKEHVLAPTNVAERMLELEETEKGWAAVPETDAREDSWRRQHEDEADPELQSAQNLEVYFARLGRTTVVDF
ncbi:hypothetical protein LTR95_010392 [Oleoguttula sp. CCFEE 5521]